jgi:hypothetical protein
MPGANRREGEGDGDGDVAGRLVPASPHCHSRTGIWPAGSGRRAPPLCWLAALRPDQLTPRSPGRRGLCPRRARAQPNARARGPAQPN